MGNCCKVVKKEKEVSKSLGDTVTVTTEDRSQRQKTLTITCLSPSLSLTVRYRPAIPLSDLKDQIVSSCPSLGSVEFTLLRDDQEILDPTATLQQLGIVPGDSLQLVVNEDAEEEPQSPEESEDIIASENNSILQPKRRDKNRRSQRCNRKERTRFKELQRKWTDFAQKTRKRTLENRFTLSPSQAFN